MDNFFSAMDSLYKEPEIRYSGLQILNKDNFLLQSARILNCLLIFSQYEKERNQY